MQARAAKDHVVTGVDGALDESLNPREVVRVDERRDRGHWIATVAQYVALRREREAREEFVADRVFNEESRARETDLARVVVHQRGLFDRDVEVGVGEDDERSLAAEFGREGHEVLGGRNADQPSGLGRAGKGDASHPWVTNEGRADFLAESLDDVKDARWKARVAHEVHQERATQG